MNASPHNRARVLLACAAPERREGASPPPVAMRRVHAHGSKTAAEISPNIGMGPVLPARRVSPKARRASHSKTSPVLQTLLNWIGPGARLVPRSRRGRSPSPMTTQNTGVGPVSPANDARVPLVSRMEVCQERSSGFSNANSPRNGRPGGRFAPAPGRRGAFAHFLTPIRFAPTGNDAAFLPLRRNLRAGCLFFCSIGHAPARLFCRAATTRKTTDPICSIEDRSFLSINSDRTEFANEQKSFAGARHV